MQRRAMGTTVLVGGAPGAWSQGCEVVKGGGSAKLVQTAGAKKRKEKKEKKTPPWQLEGGRRLSHTQHRSPSAFEGRNLQHRRGIQSLPVIPSPERAAAFVCIVGSLDRWIAGRARRRVTAAARWGGIVDAQTAEWAVVVTMVQARPMATRESVLSRLCPLSFPSGRCGLMGLVTIRLHALEYSSVVTGYSNLYSDRVLCCHLSYLDPNSSAAVEALLSPLDNPSLLSTVLYCTTVSSTVCRVTAPPVPPGGSSRMPLPLPFQKRTTVVSHDEYVHNRHILYYHAGHGIRRHQVVRSRLAEEKSQVASLFWIIRSSFLFDLRSQTPTAGLGMKRNPVICRAPASLNR
ncbi:predicted protein [Plenodomus lingam JN3]|uniref:Predicted protein n=1 Tax=Leptosphaeria maculans (strain JN3 / isolate v23.1.3 / race Av1-4-5-6-7-8) TaxID=985895 RepID=E4ZVN2_LEPMJ|nr:predicted protein [Plenodomus lingam JN3]CBX95658.1 predicted protein [Plenodomus lingam JN3]